MSVFTSLRRYAQASPSSLPASILFSHNDDTLTLFDAYPKSIFHFLILPKIKSPHLTEANLRNLWTLLQGNKACAKEVLLAMRDASLALKCEIEGEMIKRFGFAWGVWCGFHGAPSMEHLHLHVLSVDLCSDKMKTKKHYNSFHPKLGFFLDIEEVLSWFDFEPSFYATKSRQRAASYEPILKEKLTCFRCNAEMKNMPALKSHLQGEWDNIDMHKGGGLACDHQYQETEISAT